MITTQGSIASYSLRVSRSSGSADKYQSMKIYIQWLETWSLKVVTILLIVKTEKEAKLHLKKSFHASQKFAFSTWKTIPTVLEWLIFFRLVFLGHSSRFHRAIHEKYILTTLSAFSFRRRRDDEYKMPPADFRHVPWLIKNLCLFSLVVTFDESEC